MTTLHQLKQLADENNRIVLTVRMPWDQTSMARFYDYFDNNYEKGCLFDILSVAPLSFTKGEDMIEAEVVIDITDALDVPKDSYFSENPDDAEHVEKYKKEMGIGGSEIPRFEG